jgi:septal ring-binding cell division protein DamX
MTTAVPPAQTCNSQQAVIDAALSSTLPTRPAGTVAAIAAARVRRSALLSRPGLTAILRSREPWAVYATPLHLRVPVWGDGIG